MPSCPVNDVTVPWGVGSGAGGGRWVGGAGGGRGGKSVFPEVTLSCLEHCVAHRCLAELL